MVLEGNTDKRGKGKYNYHLGLRRAKAIAQVLEQYGVSKDQIALVSYGKDRPIQKGDTESTYALNRRVDLLYR